ncbi:uncharacterized protein LOC127473427 [Manacus candei]|uniref:uncharacterized protein LOC127473427 n=1 Tax=Manacus candei TaxID=415023 RepID=UPI002227F41E|nr:uncharacterized protein LOC127473427 [Manacus candei]
MAGRIKPLPGSCFGPRQSPPVLVLLLHLSFFCSPSLRENVTMASPSHPSLPFETPTCSANVSVAVPEDSPSPPPVSVSFQPSSHLLLCAWCEGVSVPRDCLKTGSSLKKATRPHQAGRARCSLRGGELQTEPTGHGSGAAPSNSQAGAREADTAPPLPLFLQCPHREKWEEQSLEENQQEREGDPVPSPPGKHAGFLYPFCEPFEADVLPHGGPSSLLSSTCATGAVSFSCLSPPHCIYLTNTPQGSQAILGIAHLSPVEAITLVLQDLFFLSQAAIYPLLLKYPRHLHMFRSIPGPSRKRDEISPLAW